MVHMRPTNDDMLDIPEDQLCADVGVDSPLVAIHRHHHRVRRLAWSSY
jgi:hypothetical protein